MRVSQTVGGSWHTNKLFQNNVNFESGKSYEYSFEARNISGTSTLRVTQQADVIKDTVLTGSFQTFTGTFEPTTSNKNINFFCNGSTSVFELDNISLKEIF